MIADKDPSCCTIGMLLVLCHTDSEGASIPKRGEKGQHIQVAVECRCQRRWEHSGKCWKHPSGESQAIVIQQRQVEPSDSRI